MKIRNSGYGERGQWKHNISSSRCLQILRSKDYFGEQYRMKLDEGRTQINTHIGAFCTLVLLTVLALFAA